MKRHLTALMILALAGCSADEKYMEAGEPVAETRFDEAPTASAAPAEEAEYSVRESMPSAPERDVARAEPKPKPVASKAEAKSKFYSFDDSLVDGELAQPPAGPTTTGFTDYGVNPNTKTAEDRFSTFAIDVDTASYTLARRSINDGYKPTPSGVRVEEFVNFFKYDYPSPDNGAFGVHMEGAPSPFSTEKDTYVVRVGVQGKHVTLDERKPVHLVFLVDVSGSMNRPDKLGLAKESLALLTNNLRSEDTVAIATYASGVKKVLPPTSVSQRSKILASLDSLQAGGGTGMSNGMELAYEMAMQTHKSGHVSRVIVVSDGDANIGPMSHEEILSRIQHYVDEGITLSTIGFGMGNYKDTMMEQLANKGNGNNYYIDGMKEAKRIFQEQLEGTLQVIAKDVKIQVEFEPETVPEFRLIGYENRKLAHEDFRRDEVDAGEIGAGHTVTALYEIKLNRKAAGKLATVRVRHKQPEGYKAEEQAFELYSRDLRTRVGDASRDFQFAVAVAGFAEILRESPYAKNLSLALVEEIASPNVGNREDRKEFMALLKKTKRL